MVDDRLLSDICLHPRPLSQWLLGLCLLTPNYFSPLTRTCIILEGAENIPRSGGAILIMNHTDCYNSLPLQYEMWRQRVGVTAVWVKGKYYEHPLLRRFLNHTNNIPVPSRGYLLSKDFLATQGRLPSEVEYRLLKRLCDDPAAVIPAEEIPVLTTFLERQHLHTPFEYTTHLEVRYEALMRRVIELSVEALSLGLNLIIFPQGTRSRRLLPGRTGAAQVALYTRAPVVPIGCNGSDSCYPWKYPLCRGGTVRYRIGPAMQHDAEMLDFQIPVPFIPCTRSAQPFSPTFQALTALMMARINALLDPPYQHSPEARPVVNSIRQLL